MFIIFVFNYYNMYPEEITSPMKNELTSVGFNDLTSANDVKQFISQINLAAVFLS